MKKIAIFLALAGILALPLTQGFSQEQTTATPEGNLPKIGITDQWGVGIKVGLSGVGLEVVKGLGNHFNVRLGYSGMAIPITTVQTLEGYTLEINGKVRLGGANLLVDYHPAKTIFHVTGGLLWNRTLIGVDVRSLSSFPYGDISIPAEDVGTINGELSPGNSFSPYIALGIGQILSKEKRLCFNFELGTFYQGSPRVALEGTGVIGPMGSENNAVTINKAIAQYSWFPALNFQVTYKIL